MLPFVQLYFSNTKSKFHQKFVTLKISHDISCQLIYSLDIEFLITKIFIKFYNVVLGEYKAIKGGTRNFYKNSKAKIFICIFDFVSYNPRRNGIEFNLFTCFILTFLIYLSLLLLYFQELIIF